MSDFSFFSRESSADNSLRSIFLSLLKRFLLCILLCTVTLSCKENQTTTKSERFTKVLPTHSGITFNNEIARFESDSLNALEFDPMFNGGGVGVADFNGDGYADIFFAGNLVSSRLYLNAKEFRFSDVTQEAGLVTTKWCTGVSVADVNQDGKSDIYVSVAGPSLLTRSNLLFINLGNNANGVPVFREMASLYGLADPGFSIQAAFFDYDRDGDLDCYVLTNAVEKTGRNRLRPKRLDGKGPSTDKLYENTGAHEGHPLFKEVSKKAGILKEGYGLGLSVTDLNDDGWLDIYCANDFVSNDVLWINNQDGTFTDRAADYFKHTAYNSMGLDVQDINNDGLLDVCVVDMLPESIERKKMMVIKTSWEYFQLARQMNYQDQYVRNVLQLNRGPRATGEVQFSEISQLAGVHATDWSWAPLLADMDHDGYKDLFVTNGYRRDITNLDYVVYLNQEASNYGNQFTPAVRKKMIDGLYKLPEVKLHNYLYRNKGDLTFEDVSESWGLEEETYSNGAVYADLDNDGDLDLVFSNIDAQAGVYRNELITSTASSDPASHYIRFQLQSGFGQHNVGVGARIKIVLPDGQILLQENLPVRGFMSTVEPVLHFGLGSNERCSAEITWANGKKQLQENLRADTLYIVSYSPSAHVNMPATPFKEAPVLTYLDPAAVGLKHRHEEFAFDEFKRTPSLPHQFSRNSPGIAVADADGNGLDDLFMGEDRGKDRYLFMQKKEGKFEKVLLGKNDFEDMGSLFLDADADGDHDLYVVSGGSLYGEKNNFMYQDRLYLNDGTGKLTRGQNLLPEMKYSGSTVVAADFDRDGDLDIFRGSRVQAEKYPYSPRSYLLQNRGEGKFADVSATVAPGLAEVGMVSAALWTDYDNDGWIDLAVVGEFMPVTFFRNEQGKLIKDSKATLQNSEGWWNSIAGGDFDLDGDTDYVAGNLGLNSQYKASAEEPVRVYAADFDQNGSIDPVISYYREGKEYAAAIRDVMYDQLTAIMRKRFVSYTAYANAGLQEVLEADERSRALILQAFEMRSCFIENKGDGTFSVRPLPMEAQFSPVFGIVVDDFNRDGFPDVLLAGNSYSSETYSGWYDASVGTLLLGDGKGSFSVVNNQVSGLSLDQDTKALAQVAAGKETWIVATNNNGPVQVLKGSLNRHLKAVAPAPMEAYGIVALADGRNQKVEFYHGGGYLSQSSRILYLPREYERVEIYSYSGEVTRVLEAE
jgi:hypothetical protein